MSKNKAISQEKQFSTKYEKIKNEMTQLIEKIHEKSFTNSYSGVNLQKIFERALFEKKEQGQNEELLEASEEGISILQFSQILEANFSKELLSKFTKEQQENLKKLYQEAVNLRKEYDLLPGKKPKIEQIRAEIMSEVKSREREIFSDSAGLAFEANQDLDQLSAQEAKKITPREQLEESGKSLKDLGTSVVETLSNKAKQAANSVVQAAKTSLEEATKTETSENVQKSGFFANGVRGKNILTAAKSVGKTVAVGIIGSMIGGFIGIPFLGTACLAGAGLIYGFKAYNQIKENTKNFDLQKSGENAQKSIHHIVQKLEKQEPEIKSEIRNKAKELDQKISRDSKRKAKASSRFSAAKGRGS